MKASYSKPQIATLSLRSTALEKGYWEYAQPSNIDPWNYYNCKYKVWDGIKFIYTDTLPNGATEKIS